MYIIYRIQNSDIIVFMINDNNIQPVVPHSHALICCRPYSAQHYDTVLLTPK